MRSPTDQLEATLKQQGFSLTKPRQVVFAALQEQEPLTMHELVSRCHNAIDRASIYRTIALFEQLDIVQRLQIGWKYKLELSGSFVHHHHHLTCTSCGKVKALNADIILEARLHELARAEQFTAHDHQLEIRGVCHTCNMKISHPSGQDQH